LLIVVLFFSCKKIDSVERKYYWRYALIPILAFALEEGLRWGRALDWCYYYDVYSKFMRGEDSAHEPLFSFLWGVFAFLRAPYPVVITFCSGLLIFSGFFLFRPYQGFLRYIIPIWVLITAPWAINVIRWFIGLSFLFISTKYFLDKKRIRWIVFFLCSVLTHYGMFLMLPIFFLLLKNRLILKPWLVAVASLLLLLLFDPSLLSHFSFLFDYMSLLSVRYEHYTDNAEDWLSGNIGVSQTISVSLLYGFVKLFPYLFFVFLSYYLIIKRQAGLRKVMAYRMILPFYNLAVVGCLLKSVSFGLELLIRYTFYFEMSFAFLCAYTLFYLYSKIKNSVKRNLDILYISLLSFFVLWKIISFCKPLYPYDEIMGYVWNETLDPLFLQNYYRMK
jgi:hypothetical protein